MIGKRGRSDRRGRRGRASVRRVVYVLESPLSKRDADRFGLRVLRDAGFEVHVWNVAPIYLPHSEKQWYEPAADFAVTRLGSKEEFRSACEGLAADDAVIMMVGVYRGQLHSHMGMLAAVSGTPALLGAVAGAHLPDMAEAERARRNAGLVRVTASDTMASVWGWCRARLSRTVHSHNWLTFAYRHWTKLTTGVRPLDIVWLGATSVQINPVLIGRETRIEYIHVFDFDLTLGVTRLALEDTQELVLIDAMGPLNPDFVTHGQAFGEYDGGDYFEPLRRILDEIESESGFSVTIAAHPRAKPGLLETLYGNRNVVYGSTAKCIGRARAVILVGPSTALNMAVVMRKPILLVARWVYPSEKIESEILSRLLDFPIIDSRGPLAQWPLLEVNQDAYDNYMARYIKRPSTPELPFWQVVANHLHEELLN